MTIMNTTTAETGDITLPAGEIGRMTRLLSQVCERRSTIPILGQSLVTHDGGGRVVFRVTNLDQDLESRIETGTAATIQSRMTVPLHELRQFATAVGRDEGKDAMIALRQATDRVIALTAAESALNVTGHAPDDFPTTKTGDPLGVVSLPAIPFAAGLRAVAPFVSREETRYYLNGIYLEVRGERATFVATDGHRLGVRPVDAVAHGSIDCSLIIPRAAVEVLLPILDHQIKTGRGNDPIPVDIHANSFALDIGDWALRSKAIDGTYPDYRRVFPKTPGFTVEMPRLGMIRAMTAMRDILGEKSIGAKFVLAKGEGTLLLTAKSVDRGEYRRRIAIAAPSQDFEIGFQAGYVRSVLESFDCETIAADFLASSDPSIWRPAGEL